MIPGDTGLEYVDWFVIAFLVLYLGIYLEKVKSNLLFNLNALVVVFMIAWIFYNRAVYFN